VGCYSARGSFYSCRRWVEWTEEKGSPAVVGFEDFGYEVIKKGGEVLGCHLMRGMEEAPAALRFDFIPALEADGRRRAERRQVGERRLGRLRWEKTPEWAGVGCAGQLGRCMVFGSGEERRV
jgi:hypothetical protein